ncbi:SAM-dependent methyltransferase [Lactobacillus sp.]|uniref:SAM-dependent methyltransferase n=1 Tax=Lactobacillus sp. TaxID=1591 RepID=UPI003F10F8F9
MTQFIEKISALAKEFADPELDRQVKEIKMIDECVSSQRMLLFAPESLGISDERFAEMTWDLSESQIKDLRALNNLLNNVRQYLSLEYGIWSLPNMETAQLIRDELGVETALEVMAGNAYWSKALSEAGIQVWATDSLEWSKSSQTGKKPFYRVENLPADQAIMKYAACDLILCSWAPNFGKADLELIAAKQHYAPAARLLFIGEKGVTNSPGFWSKKHFVRSSELRKINRSFKSYDFIKEKFFEVS